MGCAAQHAFVYPTRKGWDRDTTLSRGGDFARTPVQNSSAFCGEECSPKLCHPPSLWRRRSLQRRLIDLVVSLATHTPNFPSLSSRGAAATAAVPGYDRRVDATMATTGGDGGRSGDFNVVALVVRLVCKTDECPNGMKQTTDAVPPPDLRRHAHSRQR